MLTLKINVTINNLLCSCQYTVKAATSKLYSGNFISGVYIFHPVALASAIINYKVYIPVYRYKGYIPVSTYVPRLSHCYLDCLNSYSELVYC